MPFKRLLRFDTDASPDWPQRPWLLAATGAGAGLLIHLLTQAGTTGPAVSARGAAVLFIGIAALLIAFTFERPRAAWGVAFALGGAGAVALVSLLLGGPLAWWEELWRLICILLAVAIAAPLFQAARDEGRLGFPYRSVHDHAWTNVLLAAAAVSFTGVVFLVLFLLAALFRLIGIEAPWAVVTAPAFGWTLGGAASLGAVGWLRERVGVMRGTVGILALLAPVMGAGLAIFLLSVPFTGLAPLWEATRSTTPILLACIAGGLVIANAVIGADGDEARPPAMLWGAIAICLSLLPLAAIAVASVAARISQYGLLPERLWAVVFVGIAAAYGIGYLGALARGRRGWAPRVREANLVLAVGVGAVALVLALPIVDFNAISARSQVARLRSGGVPADRFDFGALRFAMGAPGRVALAQLAADAAPTIREPAARAQASRWPQQLESIERVAAAGAIRVVPVALPVPGALQSAIADFGMTGTMALIYSPGATEAILVSSGCEGCPSNAVRFILADGEWTTVQRDAQPTASPARARIELRRVERRQVFVDGVPAGEPFE
ncbi:Na+-transporting methylmalonyl-CoA/oxaloacetate decarboxylase gamma subunit [Sphingomonas jejuensis]|uniref:Na+-transporting methylmalonyl-CoA/oxaloacetate decarboxylase gamma subunit n=1 Tax=Sphingomonas jejuensis TaxID=904715 RepID=A0ABX0XKI0_9SPHN|nr:DUF4153 domain-containing protein [Sphingomonas jejuensis]NJC33245.1 Na+-transporting methylmalonyl-CoA/oxaloacetate decarboxylase gamma subunit [Sphingomonas jejuensis]